MKPLEPTQHCLAKVAEAMAKLTAARLMLQSIKDRTQETALAGEVRSLLTEADVTNEEARDFADIMDDKYDEEKPKPPPAADDLSTARFG